MRASPLAILGPAALVMFTPTVRPAPRLSLRAESCSSSADVLICSPLSSDTWYNGTVNQFMWNFYNPAFNNEFPNGSLSLYLYRYIQSSLQYVMVKNFTDIPTTDGQLVTTVDDSWFMEPLSPGSANVTYTYFPYLIASNLDPAEELKNIYSTYRQFETLGTLNFSVVQNSYPISHSSATPLLAQPTGSPTNSTGVDNGQQLNASSSKLQPWTIGVIVAACVAVLIAVIALFWIIRYTRRQRKLGTRRSFFTSNPKRSPGSDDAAMIGTAGEAKEIAPGMQSHGGFDNRDVSSIHSGTPIMGGGASSRRSTAMENNSTVGSTRGSGLRNSTDPEKNASIISSQAARANDLGQLPEGRQSNSVLSSTDALMIADTFRNLMRKPDWNEKDGDELEMNQPEEESDVEKQKRIGNELLRQQLAEEGTQVQRIERRPTQLNSITTAEGKATFASEDP